jgi:hypothetical protein
MIQCEIRSTDFDEWNCIQGPAVTAYVYFEDGSRGQDNRTGERSKERGWCMN